MWVMFCKQLCLDAQSISQDHGFIYHHVINKLNFKNSVITFVCVSEGERERRHLLLAASPDLTAASMEAGDRIDVDFPGGLQGLQYLLPPVVCCSRKL